MFQVSRNTRIASASRPKASVMVRSRPMWSLTQPQNGRVTPFKMRSSDKAKGTTAIAAKPRFTLVLSTPMSLATDASTPVAIKPPTPISVIMAYINQKTGVLIVSSGL